MHARSNAHMNGQVVQLSHCTLNRQLRSSLPLRTFESGLLSTRKVLQPAVFICNIARIVYIIQRVGLFV